MIVIVDYGVGNLASIVNMLRAAGVEAQASAAAGDVRAAERLILPGVGHFDHGMRMLNASGLRDAIEAAALGNRRPVLGICLGAQMLGRSSEEGREAGLGWLDMTCRLLPSQPGVRVPHMGWNQVAHRVDAPLFLGEAPDARYYFVHSYYMECADPSDSAGTTTHGMEFTGVVQRGNVFGTQFHPEKSLRHGMNVLRNFAAYTPA